MSCRVRWQEGDQTAAAPKTHPAETFERFLNRAAWLPGKFPSVSMASKYQAVGAQVEDIERLDSGAAGIEPVSFVGADPVAVALGLGGASREKADAFLE